jgi:hypothetical protein
MTPHRAVIKFLIAAAIAVMGFALIGLTFDKTTAAMQAVSPRAHVVSEMRQAATDASDPVTDTTMADFQAGSGCYVAPSSGGDIDGELILTPSVGTSFPGTTLPTGWYSGTYASGGAGTFSGGLLTLSGAYAGYTGTLAEAGYPPSQTLEFSATFGSGAPYDHEHIGLAGTTDLNQYPWAIFTTNVGDGLYASTLHEPEGISTTLISGTYIGSGHRYRIQWTPTSVIYSIDGQAVVTHTSPLIPENMWPVASSGVPGNNLVLDWLRMSPYATSCAFQSRVFDAGQTAHWQDLTWTGQQPAGTSVGNFETRSGDVITPGLSWMPVNGTVIASPNGQYLQYRVALTTTDSMKTPAVESVSLSFGAAKISQTITVVNHAPATAAYGASFTVSATASSGLAVTYSASGACTNTGSTFTMTSGTGTCTVRYDQAGNTNYNAAPQVSETVTAQKVNQTITVVNHAPATAAYGASFTLTGTASSGLAVTYSASGVCTNTGNTFTLTSGTGTCTVQYDQAGNANYNTATQVTETVTAQKVNQTITVVNHAPATASVGSSFTVTGTASSGLAVTYSASGVCTNTGNTFTMTSATGTCTVRYDQIGNANYNAATQVTEAVTAQNLSQTITVVNHAPATAAYGASFTVTATASSGLAVVYSASGVCTNTGNSFTLTSGTGTCTVKYDQPGNANYGAAAQVTETVTAQKLSQTITVVNHAPASATYGASFTVTATASSGLAVAYNASGACTNTGNTVTLTSGTGTCTVQYDQAGNANYNAATQVAEAVTAQKANQTITVVNHAPATAAYGASFTVTATASSGLAVTYSASGACTNSGNTYTLTSPTGTCTVRYDQAGNANYGAATQVTETVTAQKANQTITVVNHAPATAAYGASFTVTGTASSGLAVAYSASGACTNIGGTFTMSSGTGTCTVRYDQAGNANYNAATQVTETVTAQKANQTITVVNHAPATAAYGASFTVTATASSGLAVAYSASGTCTNIGGTFTMTSGTGTCTVRFDQAGNANYNAATQVTETVMAQKANQTITVVNHAPATAAYGASFTVTATASSGLAVAYSASGACTNTGNTVTLTSGTGTCTVQYDQAGNANYGAATQVTESVTAQKANQAITVVNHAPATAAYGASFTVTATAASGLAVTYSASGACTNVGNAVTLTSGSGTCTVRYDQAGNANYNSAAQVTETVTAQKANQTITFGALPDRAVDAAPFTVTASASSGLAVTFTASGPCSVAGTTVTLTGAPGTCTVTAHQSGNGNYNAAPDAPQSFKIVFKVYLPLITGGSGS